MKLARIVLLLLCTSCMGTTGHAQTDASMPTAPVAAAAASPIAVLNFNAAVLGTAEGQKSLGALQKKYAPREQLLQKLNDQIETSRKLLSDPVTRLTDAEKNQRLTELSTKEKQLQRDAEDFKNDSQAEYQQAYQQIATRVFSFLQNYAQQRGYSVVIERGTESAPVVWYAAGNIDITDELIKGYNAKTK